jgi:hypothetical protein
LAVCRTNKFLLSEIERAFAADPARWVTYHGVVRASARTPA